MTSTLLLSSLLLVACGDKDGDTGTDATDTDGTDTDADTDTDGTDTDADTDTDGTDTDTDGTDTDGTDTDEDTDTDGSTTASIYEQLGGETGVRAVIDGTIANVAADASINWMFADADIDALKNSLHDQICAATGGGCTYSGGDMATVHSTMAITDDQWEAFVGDFLASLDTLGVDYTPTFDGGLPADALIVTLAGMKGDIVTDAAGDTVYFNQLGGHAAVSAVIDGMLVNVAADSRINGFFASTDIAALDAKLVDQVCEATGGYCTYDGLDMATAHSGMCISDADFDALVEDLLVALDDLSVPYSSGLDGSGLADTLLLALLGMRDDIVQECS
ncbi:MAG: group 1 truncated hemoglobin [Alphaproteobacteria bacterium]|nr:group 1 truncated hemoglobin [Alphaproteobacteria bacterium]